MRIGVMLGGTDGPNEAIDEVVAYARRLEAMGFSSLWMANIFGLEAITILALVGRETERIELGTAAVPSYRGMLDREGIEGPTELALVGNATELRARIEQLREIGVTDFMAAIVPTQVRPADETRSFLTEVCA